MKELKETAFNYIVGEPTATFYTAEQKWINKINKLDKDYPNDVKITHVNPDGSLTATIPVKWLKIHTPRNISDEQREAMKQRMKNARDSRA